MPPEDDPAAESEDSVGEPAEIQVGLFREE
jgi:hypothetical protein